MAIRDLAKQAPTLCVLWIVAALMIVLIVIIYILQSVQINRNGDAGTIRNLSNGLAGIGIGLCVLAGIFLIFLIGLLRDVRNITSDASSIYVSRKNLLLNWFTGAATEGRISGNPAGDTQLCYQGFSDPNTPGNYDTYRAFIKNYDDPSRTTPQNYEAYDSTSAAPKYYSVNDDLANQQKLSLAYYRYVYCTQTYFQDILNKKWQNISFLPSSTVDKLKTGTSNCTGDKIPDTQACLNGLQPTDTNCQHNPCFTALNQSIAAQCLLYDDHVYNIINASSNPKGVLDAFDLGTPPMTGNFTGISGYRVRPPDPTS